MMLKIYLCIILTLIFISCQENEKKKFVENKKSTENNVIIEISNDTISMNEFVKGIIYIKKSHFNDSKSKIALVLEADENFKLKKDLSNEYQIPIEVFQNLSNDSINQKWFKEYDFFKSVVFGKKFNESGNKKIRGYVLEYLTEEPPLDSIFPKGKVWKEYFEKDIYVIHK